MSQSVTKPNVQHLWDVSASQEQVATLTNQLAIAERNHELLDKKFIAAVKHYETEIDRLRVALNAKHAKRFEVGSIETFYAGESA